jgi:hypothetical protein
VSRRILVFFVSCLIVVTMSAVPALARHGADDPPGHEKRNIDITKKARSTITIIVAIAKQR